MSLIDILKFSAINAFRGKTRSVLTALSVLIGVSSVILVSSIGTSGERFIKDQISNFGFSGISLYKSENKVGSELYGSDAEKLMLRFNNIAFAMPISTAVGNVKTNRKSYSAFFLGVGADADKLCNIRILHGRIPNKSDIEMKRKILVVDDTFAERVYHRTNIVGKTLTLALAGQKDTYKIVGVIKSQKEGIGKLFGNNIPEFVYLPYSTLNKFKNSEDLSQIAIKCVAESENNGAEFTQYLNKIKKTQNAYKSENISSHIGEVEDITGIVSTILSAIAAISLCVAGLGVMNTMFSSTAERYKEIGICMALGATSSDVAFCFLAESVLISIIGGTLGAVIGFGASAVIFNLLNIESLFSIKLFFGSELISLLFGAIFSVIPALKASRLNPINALRSE